MSYGDLVIRDFVLWDFVLEYLLGLLHLWDFVLSIFRGFCPWGFFPRGFCHRGLSPRGFCHGEFCLKPLRSGVLYDVACTTLVHVLVYCDFLKEVRLGGWGTEELKDPTLGRHISACTTILRLHALIY